MQKVVAVVRHITAEWWSGSKWSVKGCWVGVLLLLVGGGCAGRNSARPGKGQEFHPNPERLADLRTFDWIVTEAEQGDSVLHQWANRLQQARLQWQRGALASANRYHMFGDISDVVIDSEGRVIVLDFDNQEVRLYDPSGQFVEVVGKQGEGPGEYMQAGYLLIGENDSLYVYDNTRGFFVVYHRNENGYAFKRILDLPERIPGLDYVCLQNERYIVINKPPYYSFNDPLFYKVDIMNNRLVNMDNHRHYMVEEKERFLNLLVHRAFMACGSKHVVGAFLYYPIIDILFSNDGNVHHVFLKHIVLQPFLMKGNSRARYFPSEVFIKEFSYSGKLDKPSGITLLSDEILLYVFVRYEAERGKVLRKYPMAYLMNLNNKKAMLLNLENYPFAVIEAYRDSILVGYRWDMYQRDIPHIAYYVLPKK